MNPQDPKRLIEASRLAELALDRLSAGAAGPGSVDLADDARACLEAALRALHAAMLAAARALKEDR